MQELDVAIIGGGIVGASTAYYLSRTGVPSTLFEENSIACRASGLAYGGLVSVSGFGLPGPMSEIAQLSERLHRELRRDIVQETGIDCQYRTRDTLNVAFSETELDSLTQSLAWINESTHVEASELTSDEVLNLESRVNPKICGGTLLTGTTEVNSRDLTRSLIDASKCDVVHHCVQRLEIHSDTFSLWFDDHDSREFGCVVVANGSWVTPLLLSVELSVPVPPLKGEILRLQTDGPPLQHSIGWNNNYVTTKLDGLTWAGTTESHNEFNEDTTMGGRSVILFNVAKMLPKLGINRIVRQTACLRPTTPDNLPIVGSMARHRSLFVATGAGRKGILYGPAMGKSVADLIVNNLCEIELERFSPDRFLDKGR